MARLLIVSNRLPVVVKVQDGGITVQPSSGGLATGLRGPHERSGGLWIGWPGDVSGFDTDQRAAMARMLAERRAVPIELTPDEVRGYYEGFPMGFSGRSSTTWSIG